MELQIISYNILADYLNSSDYILVNKKYLDNDYRNKLLLKKLKKVITNKTIICLQEVGPTQLSSLYTFFTNNKFNCISIKDLVIFYPNNCKIIFTETNYINSLAKKYLKKDKLIDNVNKFNQAFIILQLQINNKKIYICNTHLVSNPKFNNTIKVLQSYLLAKRLEKYNKVILCGDFNSTPNSNPYKLLSTGIIKYPYYNDLKIKNNFSSSYSLLYGSDINITTHTTNITTPIFTDTIDYIWITNNITPIKSNIICKKNELNKKNFLPNKNEPSDHYMLIVLLKI